MKQFTLKEWADYMGLTLEEVYEPDIAYIIKDGNIIYKQLESTGELIEID